jgi:two-component system, sensor histidine kinase
LRILYLEDFEPDLKLIRQYMKSTCHDFVSVSTLYEAEDYLERNQPDVFLCDIVIQGETAYDLIAFAAQQQFARHIIAVTAKALPADQRRCLDLGCTQVICKPFTVDDLEQVLETLN